MYNVIARWFKLGGVALDAPSNSYALVLLACIGCLVFPRVADAVASGTAAGWRLCREQHG